MADNKLATGVVIHGFAVAHAATAALLAQTMIGDEAALTALTGAMIVTIAKMNGAHWGVGKARKFLGLFIGNYAGTRGAAFLIKWIPGIGNAANAAVTFTITEVLGWATYAFVKDDGNRDPESMTKNERDNLWKKARDMREQESANSERIYNSMSASDKKEYDDAIRELKKTNLTESERNRLIDKIDELTKKYTS